MKTLSENGIKFIKSFEGCHLTAYDDLQPKIKLTSSTKIKGTLTIGWGHTKNVYVGQTITQKQADDLFLQDMKGYIAATNNKNNVPFIDQLNQNQFDALVSFCYNCGAGNLKRLCSNGLGNIPVNILAYVKSKGITLNGLVRRRNAERNLFLTKGSEEQLSQEFKNKTEKRLGKLEEQMTLFDERNRDIDPPQWLLEEFPNILDVMSTRKAPYHVWRSVAVAIRYMRING